MPSLGRMGLFVGASTVSFVEPDRVARGVVYTNQADLNAFVVASDDGITYAAGETAYFAGMTDKSKNGPWVVGPVVAGVAQLARPTDWQAGATIPSGVVYEIAAGGTNFGGTSWKALGSGLIGTNDPDVWPKDGRYSITMAAGTYTIGAGGGGEPLFLKNANSSCIQPAPVGTPGAPPYLSWYWLPTSITAGIAGTAAVQIDAIKQDGTVDAGAAWPLDVLIVNW